jgi:hypothetical protein
MIYLELNLPIIYRLVVDDDDADDDDEYDDWS